MPVITNKDIMSCYQSLFNYLAENFNITPTRDEMDEIIEKAEEVLRSKVYLLTTKTDNND